MLIFKNNAPFRSCISKVNNVFIDNAEDFDIVMPMYNLYNFLEYSDNYCMWNYYGDEINDDANEINAANNRINNNKTITNKSFEYKTKSIGSMPNNENIFDAYICSINIFEQFLKLIN